MQDVEEESVGAKKPASARAGNGSKRGRAAEVHNLSERVSMFLQKFITFQHSSEDMCLFAFDVAFGSSELFFLDWFSFGI